MAKRSHDPATKTAVLTALAEKQPVEAISRLYSVPRRTIYYWRDEANGANGAPPESAPRPAQARAAHAPVSESEQALRGELRAALHKVSILRQALLIVAEG